MTTLAELVIAHAGHRLTVVEPQPGKSVALKCFSCSGRLTDLSGALGLRPTSAKPTSTSRPEPPRDPKPNETCDLHLGEYAHSCRPCASERKASGPPRTPRQPGADPTSNDAWQAARQRFGGTP